MPWRSSDSCSVMSAVPSSRSRRLAQWFAPAHEPGDVLGLSEAGADGGDQCRLGPLHDPVAVGVGQHHAALDRTRVEGGDIHSITHVGVADVDVLEAAVTAEPVDDIGADPATDASRAFENAHRDSGLLQRPCAGESGDPGADHGHVGGVHCWKYRPLSHCVRNRTLLGMDQRADDGRQVTKVLAGTAQPCLQKCTMWSIAPRASGIGRVA